MQLKALKRLGFLRRVADYPVVYQITRIDNPADWNRSASKASS
jgi:hypothetical protein